MYLKSLGLEHFRCYESLEMRMGPGLHVLLGGNAQGKTSVLEAIHVLAVTRSHRSALDKEMVQWGAEWARVTGDFVEADDADLSVRVTIRQGNRAAAGDSGRKTVEVNSLPRQRLSDIIGQVAAVLFGPDDLALIKGPPAQRRHFLNAGISQVDPVYLADLMRYRQALRQRNECLRAVAAGATERAALRGWDAQLVECGARVSLRRARFAADLQPHVRGTHAELTDGHEDINLRYSGDLADAADLDAKRGVMQRLLAEGLDRDLALGRTLRGPHRDELDVSVAGRSLRVYGSQGQQRTAALSLTLAEALVMQQWREEAPVVLLDDCLSELDDLRARRMLSLAASFQQLIVTTASWSSALDSYRGPMRVYEVGDGAVTPRAKMAATREAQFSGIGEAVEKYLKTKGYVRLGRESMVPIVWAEVVGEWYRKHTEVTRVEQGVVTVACDSAARAQQLQLDAPQIIKALNARIGGRSVKELRPSSGAIRRLDKVAAGAPNLGPLGPERAELERIDVSPGERDWARATAAAISEEGLRRRFEAVLMKARQLARWQVEHGYAPCQVCGALVRPDRVLCSACDPGRAPRQGTDEVIPWKRDYQWD